MVFDKLAEAFDGANVRLLLTDSGLQEDFNLYRLTKKVTTPRNRIDTRGGAADFWGHQLIEYTYETVVSKQMYQYLQTQNTLNARSVMPTVVCQVLSDSLSGVGADDIQEDFSAQFPDLESESIDGNYYWIRVHMIVINTTVVIS